MFGELIGLDDFRATLAMFEAVRFGPVDAPVNTLGIRCIVFDVDDIDGSTPAPTGQSRSAR